MTDHKFEPFQPVLVRDDDNREWNASFFSHIEDDSDYKFMACGMFWRQCIPYTPETAHLLGTPSPTSHQLMKLRGSRPVNLWRCADWTDDGTL